MVINNVGFCLDALSSRTTSAVMKSFLYRSENGRLVSARSGMVAENRLQP